MQVLGWLRQSLLTSQSLRLQLEQLETQGPERLLRKKWSPPKEAIQKLTSYPKDIILRRQK